MKTTVKLSELQDSFDRYRRLPRRGDLDPNTEFQWWQEGVANLAEVAPIIAKQYQMDHISCIMAVRAQFPGGDIDAIRRFCEWCIDKHPG